MAGRRRKSRSFATKAGSAKRRKGRVISGPRRSGQGSKIVSGGANPFSQRTRTHRGKGQRRDRKGRFA